MQGKQYSLTGIFVFCYIHKNNAIDSLLILKTHKHILSIQIKSNAPGTSMQSKRSMLTCVYK